MTVTNIDSIDLNLMRIFTAVYEEKSASKAALRLGMTQSAVSANLSRLRVLYQDPLFSRTGRGLAPTLFAMQLYAPLKEALERFSETFELYSVRRGMYNGRTITIGLSDDFEIALGSMMVRLADMIPSAARLFYKQTNSMLVEEMLVSRQIDLAITGGGTKSEDVCASVVGTGNYLCLVDPRTFDAPVLDLDAYVSHAHVLVSSGGFFGAVDEALAARGLKRTVRVSTSHFAALPHLLIGTNCVATIPAHAARAIAAVTPLKLCPAPIAFPSYSVNLSWRNFARKDKVLLELIRIFEEHLQGCLMDHPAEQE